MSKREPMRQWEIKARIEQIETVIVSARTADEALDTFRAGRWESAGVVETVNWEAIGQPKEDA